MIQVLNNAHGKALALSAARESVVLLQNNGSALPLALGARVKKLLVVGPIAIDAAVMMGGTSDYCPEHIVTVLEGLQVLVRLCLVLVLAVVARVLVAAVVVLVGGGGGGGW
jgi:beta-glucosidase-like glycosyl hydrolase